MSDQPSIFRAMPGFPWLNPCPRCGYSGDSCDCTVFERARAAHPGLVIAETQTPQ
jgi:hypothetical protein